MRNILCSLIIIFFSNFCFGESNDDTNSLPEEFVYLSDIDPTIIVRIKYFYNDNFIGYPLEGYKSPQAILTKSAAEALKKVQNDLRNQGYYLVVYDAYRPQKAVQHMVRWAQDVQDQKTKQKFYPNVLKSELINLGYINEKSTHSNGSSVDVTIIAIDQDLKPINEIKRVLKDGSEIIFQDDGTLDMGSSYDLFDPASAHNYPYNMASSDINRRILKTTMLKYGFLAHESEWWHYTLAQEPFPDTMFDFDVE